MPDAAAAVSVSAMACVVVRVCVPTGATSAELESGPSWAALAATHACDMCARPTGESQRSAVRCVWTLSVGVPRDLSPVKLISAGVPRDLSPVKLISAGIPRDVSPLKFITWSTGPGVEFRDKSGALKGAPAPAKIPGAISSGCPFGLIPPDSLDVGVPRTLRKVGRSRKSVLEMLR